MVGHLKLTVALLMCATIVVADQGSQGPPAQPTFRAGVEYVEVDAVVTDQQGEPVGGLTRDDFEVFEDGRLQTISAFSAVDVPIEMAVNPSFAATLEPDAQTNERAFDARVYVMVLDDLHVDPLRSQQVKQAARRFIVDHLGPNDMMAILFTGRDDTAQDFTNNRPRLLRAVEQFVGRKLPSATLGANDAYHAQIDIGATTPGGLSPAAGPPGSRDEYEAELAHHAESTLSTLRQVGDWVGAVRGRRRAVLLFSEGLDYDLANLIDNSYVNGRERSFTAMRDTLLAMMRSNISVYSIDPRGLSTTGEEAITVSGFAGQTDRSSGIGLGSLSAEMRRSQDSLRELSERTGGFAAVNRNDTAQVLDQIVRENSSYYVLAYYPDPMRADGKIHRIEITTKRQGLSVRGRRGYVAPTAKAKAGRPETAAAGQELQNALSSPVPVGGLTMRLFSAPMKGSKKNASVVVGIELDGKDLTFGPGNKVELSFAAVDRRSKVFGSRRDTLPLDVDSQTRSRAQQSAVRVVNRIDLPPGRYRLRAAALDAQKHLVGSVISDLDVPDFYKESLTASGIMVTSRAGSSMLTAVLDDQLRTLLPSPVVALRTFRQDDDLDLFAEVYDNTGKTPHTLAFTTTILNDRGEPVVQTGRTRDSREAKDDNGAIRYSEYLPLKRLVPGAYVVNLEVRHSTADLHITKQVLFRVVRAE